MVIRMTTISFDTYVSIILGIVPFEIMSIVFTLIIEKNRLSLNKKTFIICLSLIISNIVIFLLTFLYDKNILLYFFYDFNKHLGIKLFLIVGALLLLSASIIIIKLIFLGIHKKITKRKEEIDKAYKEILDSIDPNDELPRRIW